MCEICEKDFYLSGNNCIQRTVLNSLCVAYDPYKDECLECKANYYLVSNECKPFPEGIPNCQLYLSLTECLLCKTGFYLNKNECQQLPTVSEVENCAFYEDEKVCKECESGFLIINGECVKTEA